MRAYDGERKITRQLTQYNSNGSDWANIARDAFDFALLAKQRFKHGDSVDKKVVFKAIGVNPILLNQKLEYQPRFIFLKIKEGVKKTNDRTGQLESRKSPSNQANLENYLKSSVWCTIWDDVGTYLTSSIDPKEKASLIIAFAHFKKEGKQ